MITLICLWGHREGKAAKTVPSMLVTIFDNRLLFRTGNIAQTLKVQTPTRARDAN